MYQEDQLLLNKIKQSDLDAFSSIFSIYHPILFKYIFYKTQNYDLSQDIVQETFLKVWLNRKSLKPHLSFFSYIVRISENILKDNYKKQAVREKYKDVIRTSEMLKDDDPENILNDSLLQDKIQLIVDRHLPLKCKQIFMLSLIEGLPNQEIADQLCITKKTVENQLYHALKVLRAKLKHYLS